MGETVKDTTMTRRILILAFIAVLLPIAAQAQAPPRVQRDIAYAEPRNERQLLDVYAPASGSGLPVVVWVHGGGWMAGSKNAVDHKPAAFTAKGFVFVAMNYRFVPQVTMETIVRDVAKSVGWVHANIARHGGDPDRIFLMGHSAGGYLSLILAALSADPANGIPRPYALVSVEPGGLGAIPNTDFSKIDDATYIVLVVGTNDDVACKTTALFLWNEIKKVRDANKDFLLVRSDDHGSPPLYADHYFPATVGFLGDATSLNALDFFVTFKLSVAVLNCAFKRQDCTYAVGDGRAEQVDMGLWSDARPVAPMIWAEDPNTLSTVCEDPPPYGCGSVPSSSP
jgi:pimeloyl-ACP methyl ester carboxylesterase